ncbi:hypothetical protein AAF712_006035 [Marasmius tenuissimus]|uniref:Uncharacterized protein n=1 Tax=Marasmius tenuissimus TaxID=585030 RepID=A0ABR2ZYR6_9AGAR
MDRIEGNSKIWDDTLREIDRVEPREKSTGIWENWEVAEAARSTGASAWDGWDRDIGEQRLPRRESPMKKRRARASGGNVGQRHGVRKHPREDSTAHATVATHPSPEPLTFPEQLSDFDLGGVGGPKVSVKEVPNLDDYT